MNQNAKIRTNYVFNAMYQLTSLLVPLVTMPLLSRVLHAGGLGRYSYAYSIAYYFYIFIRLGLHSYGNRTIAYVKNDSAAMSKIFWEIYSFQALMGVAVTMLYFVYCMFLAVDQRLSLILSLIVLAGAFDLTWFLYGLEEFRVTAIRDIATKILTAVCIFLFVKEADDVWVYAVINSLGFFVNQIVVLPIVAKKVRFVRPEKANIISHIKPNLVLFLPTVAVSLYKTMDKVMLGVLSSEAEVGYYHSCENIIRVPLALITALGTVMLPRMSNMLSTGAEKKQIENVFDMSMSFAVFVSTSVCLGIMSVSKEFVPLFYGSGFEKCVDLFYIILPSCIFVAFANVIRTQYLLPRKMDRLFVISLFTGAAVNVVLNYLLIPRLESVGAAIGTLAAEIVVCVFQSVAVFADAHIGRNLINSIPFLVAGIAMFLLFRNFTVTIPNQIVALGVKILICGIFYMMVLGLFWIGKRTVIKYSRKKRKAKTQEQ